jgi:hypothetical protein
LVIDIDASSNLIVGGSTSDTAMVSGGETPILILYSSDGLPTWKNYYKMQNNPK